MAEPVSLRVLKRMSALTNIDLHTLRVLDEIFKTGSLSRTADRLELSQPAISMVLRKLRRHFNDKLFVRVGNDMKPTPQADGMRHQVSAAIAAIETALNYRNHFDPVSTERAFRISVSDIGQVVMVPRLVNAINAAAPKAKLELSSISERTTQLLESGSIDLAVGLVPHIADGFLQRALHDESFVVLVRHGHPSVGETLTPDQFKREGHIVVVSSSATHLVLDKALEQHKIRRDVKVRVPNFMILAKLVSQTDYLAILPRRAGMLLAADFGVRALDPPFDLPRYQVRCYWHDRKSSDAGCRWLRNLFQQLFAE